MLLNDDKTSQTTTNPPKRTTTGFFEHWLLRPLPITSRLGSRVPRASDLARYVDISLGLNLFT